MKNIHYFLALTLFFAISSCTKDDDSNKPKEATGSSDATTYAMTAKINGSPNNMYNALNTNISTTTLYDYYPSTEFIRLQGCVGGPTSKKEINIWIKRTDFVVGAYTVGLQLFDGSKSFISYTDDTNTENELTVAGKIYITSIDKQSKRVTGAFNFTTSDDPTAAAPVINNTIAGGTFNYRYDVD